MKFDIIERYHSLRKYTSMDFKTRVERRPKGTAIEIILPNGEIGEPARGDDFYQHISNCPRGTKIIFHYPNGKKYVCAHGFSNNSQSSKRSDRISRLQDEVKIARLEAELRRLRAR